MVESGGPASILDEYDNFVSGLDAWFRSIRSKYGARMKCREGCTSCCSGLFDIPIPDAFRVARALHRLSPSLKSDVSCRASTVHGDLLREAPELEEPYFLDAVSETRIDFLTDVFGSVRCPFLSGGDICLIYEYRPSACVLEGIPMVDVRDGLFGDWCELNFTGGLERAVEEDLRLDYYEIEATVRRIAAQIIARVPALPRKETTLFLPSVVAVFESFWKNLLINGM